MNPKRSVESTIDHIFDPEREERLDTILAKFLASKDSGSSIQRKALLSTHPDLADELREFFDNQDQIGRLAAPLKQITRGQRPGPQLRNIGEYEIREELARGGMGVVYKAWQPSLQRFVAVKMLLEGTHASEEDLRRFQNEAEVVAALDHPHIVPIYEVGTTPEQYPYLCMKLVEGHNLSRRVAGGPPTPESAARLMKTLAETVHYAHQRGVLHRDLKPANILIEGDVETTLEECRPFVSDFGLAQRQRDEVDANSIARGLTPTGALLGTPSYMSPEQALGRSREITVATDVYGLGAILYELLTGRAPFQADSPYQTIREILESTPTPPSHHFPKVPRDLETICLKCLEKEPHRRYADARELGDDLGRFLAGEPVRGRRIGSVGRTLRWMRRQPFVASLVVALLVSLVVGFSAVTWLWREADRNYRDALAHKEEAERQLQAADTTFFLAHEVVNEFCLGVSSDLAIAPGLQHRNRELLESALRYYEKFLELRGDDPKLRREFADTQARIAGLLVDLGEHEAGRDWYRKAESTYRDLQAQGDTDWQLERQLAGTLMNIATIAETNEQRLQKFSAALGLYEESLQKHPDNLSLAAGRAAVLSNMGTLYGELGDREKAIRVYRTAAKAQKELLEKHPNRGALQKEYAFTLTNLAAERSHESDGLPEAIEAMQKVLTIRKHLLLTVPTDPHLRADVAQAHHYLGIFQRMAGDWDEGVSSIDEAYRLRKQLLEENPLVTEFQLGLGVSLLQRGFSFSQSKQDKLALESYSEAKRRLQKLVDREPKLVEPRRRLGIVLYNVGTIFGRHNQRKDERIVFEEAAMHQRRLAAAHPQNPDLRHHLAKTLHNLAFNVYLGGDRPGSLDLVAEALPHSLYAYSCGPNVPEYKGTLNVHYLLVAEIATKEKRVDQTIETILERCTLWESTPDQLFHCVWELGRLALEPGISIADRERCQKRMLEILEKAVTLGYRNLDKLQNEKMLASIRDDPRFVRLVAQVEQTTNE